MRHFGITFQLNYLHPNYSFTICFLVELTPIHEFRFNFCSNGIYKLALLKMRISNSSIHSSKAMSGQIATGQISIYVGNKHLEARTNWNPRGPGEPVSSLGDGCYSTQEAVGMQEGGAAIARSSKFLERLKFYIFMWAFPIFKCWNQFKHLKTP